MRRANDSDFVMSGDVLVGINLGADFTSEHEWGIKGIKRELGIPSGDKDWGILRRKITKVPATPAFHWGTGYKKPKEEPGQGFYLYEVWNKSAPDFSKNSELSTWGDKTLACAWDESSFGVFSTSPQEIEYLKTIYDAFLALDGVVFLGGGGVFQNSGLVLGIASRVPQEFMDGWYKADKDHYDLDQEVEATGIRQLLKEKGCGYFALSPRRQEDGSIRYWLNPKEQQKNNYGWFGLDDLKKWADGAGKIPKETDHA